MSSIYSDSMHLGSRPHSNTSTVGRQPLSEQSASQRNVNLSRPVDSLKNISPTSKTSPLRKNYSVYDDINNENSPSRRGGRAPTKILTDDTAYATSNGGDGHVIHYTDFEAEQHAVADSYSLDDTSEFPIPKPHFDDLPPIEIAAEEMRRSEDLGTRPAAAQRLSAPSARYSYSIFPSDTNSKAPRLSLASTIGRTRSQSAASTGSYGLYPHLLPEADPANIPPVPPVPPQVQARPRSISTPVMPSNTIAPEPIEEPASPDRESPYRDQPATEPIATTTARAMYPAPRRLQRKRADPQLGNAASTTSRQHPQSRAASASSTQRPAWSRPNMVSGRPGHSGRQGAVSPVVEEVHSRSSHSSHGQYGQQMMYNGRSGPPQQFRNQSPKQGLPAFESSMRQGPMNGYYSQAGFIPSPSPIPGDLPAEVQMSMAGLSPFQPSVMDFNPQSRPSTSSSGKSGRVSLSRWLNDSYTSWAKIYYRNENALRLEVPPNILQIAEDGTITSTPSKRSNARLTQSSTMSSKSQSSMLSAIHSIPPTPPVPAQYLQQQQQQPPDRPMMGLGYNSPRRKPAPEASSSSPPGGVPLQLTPNGPPRPGQYGPDPGYRGPAHGQFGQYGPGPGQFGPRPGFHGRPPGQPGPAQGQWGSPPPRGRGYPGLQGMGPSGQWIPAQQGNSGHAGPHPFGPGGRYRTPSPGQYRGPSGIPPHMQRDQINQPQRYYPERSDNSINSGEVSKSENYSDHNTGESDRSATPEEPPDSATDMKEDSPPGSAGFQEKVYIPRVRPRQQDDEPVSPISEEGSFRVEPVTPIPAPHAIRDGVPPTTQVDFEPESPDILPRSDAHPVAFEKRQLTYDGSKGMFDKVNRQIVLFCVGFVFPLAWMLAACLSLPPRPEMRQIGSDGFYAETPPMTDLFNTTDVVRYQKARRWRFTNRIMSILGVCIIVIIGACAGVATR